MYLAFNDLADLFADYQGIQVADHLYYTVSDKGDIPQPRGIFLPFNEESGELQEAIANGAIAAIWDKKKKLPHYTPTHFPVFFTNDPVAAIRSVLQFYIEKIDGDKAEKMNMTKFLFLDKNLLKDHHDTYDIAVMLEKLSNYSNSENTERRG